MADKFLNKRVARFIHRDKMFEVDQLLDTVNPIMYHLFDVSDSKHGKFVGEFSSIKQAISYIRKT